MKSFVHEHANICNLEVSTLLNSYKYCVYGGKTVVVEGQQGLVKYCPQSVVFAVSDGRLAVVGSSLVLGCFGNKVAVVTGQIDAVEVQK
ncbi:MAG: YabP/YqfC family sporulation protein [Clostridia bacterium]|nr:YabP/YqfC family sporulation protein [Clostridia bacterium]